MDQIKPRQAPPKPRTRSQMDLSTPEPIDIDNDSVQVSLTPILSRAPTPDIAIDERVMVPSDGATPSDVIDVDNPSHSEMDNQFSRMSIACDNDETSYDHRNDTSIDVATKEAIEQALQEERQHTRQTATIRKDDTDTLAAEDDEDIPSITEAIRRKWVCGKSVTRRVFGKTVPLDAYDCIFWMMVNL